MAKHGIPSKIASPLPDAMPGEGLAVRASPIEVVAERRGSNDGDRLILRTVWRDLTPVAAILGGAQMLAIAAETGGGQPTKFLVLAALMAAAAWRPGTAFYSVMLGNSLYLSFGELTVVPVWRFLGPGILLAGLAGSPWKHIFSLLKKPPFVVTAVFVGWVTLVSIAVGALPESDWYSTVLLLATGLGYQLLARDRESLLSTWGAVLAGAALLGGLTCHTYLSYGFKDVHYLKDPETKIADPNYLSSMIALGCVPALVLAREMIGGRKVVGGVVVGALGGLCLFSLIFLASRGILLAVGVALVVVAALSVRRIGIKFVAAIGVVAILISVGLSRLAEFQGGELELTRRLTFGGHAANPTGERSELAEAAVQTLAARGVFAMLAGSGPDSNFEALRMIWGSAAHTHNLFLEYVLDYGLIGLGLFLALYWVAIRSAMRARPDVRLTRLGQLILLAIAGLSINPLAEFANVVVLGLAVAYCGNQAVPRLYSSRLRLASGAESPPQADSETEGSPLG